MYAMHRTMFGAARQSAGLDDIRFHDIRAKSATDEPETAQERLQHSDKAMTDHYIKIKRALPVKPINMVGKKWIILEI